MRVATVCRITVCRIKGLIEIKPTWVNPNPKCKGFELKGICTISISCQGSTIEGTIKLRGSKPSGLIVRVITKEEALQKVKGYKTERLVIKAWEGPLYYVLVRLTPETSYEFVALNVEIDDSVFKILLKNKLTLLPA